MDIRFKRHCKAKNVATGEDCRQAPLRDREFCFWHDPDNAETAQGARRLGAQRAKREGSVAAAMQIDGIGTIADIRRVLEVVLYDTLALQNGVPRNRLLISLALGAATLLKDGEFEDRLDAIESVIEPKLKKRFER